MFWNLAAIFIASTTFFGSNVLYGDMFAKESFRPENMTSMGAVFDMFLGEPFTFGGSFFGMNISISLGFVGIMALVTIAGIGLAKLTNSWTPIGLLIIGNVFLVMMNNSLRLLNTFISKQFMGSSTMWYLLMMVLLGIAFLFVVEVYDVTTNQRSTD